MEKRLNTEYHPVVLSAFSGIMEKMSITCEDVKKATRKLQLPKIDHALELQLKTAGLEVENGLRNVDIEFCKPDGFIFYKRRPMIVYIKDQYRTVEQYKNKKFNPFHVCYCDQLRDNVRNHKIQRYVVTNNISGEFSISLTVMDEGNVCYEEEERIEKLRVCQSCLRKLNWENFKSFCNNTGEGEWYKGGDARKRQKIVSRFDIKKFFSKVEDSFFSGELDLYSSVASLDDKYSLQGYEKFEIKKSRGFKCEYCGKKRLAKDLQIHHKDHNKGNNTYDNLAVICYECHDHIHEIEGGFKQGFLKK